MRYAVIKLFALKGAYKSQFRMGKAGVTWGWASRDEIRYSFPTYYYQETTWVVELRPDPSSNS